MRRSGAEDAYDIGGFTDLSADRAAGAANTFTYTLNLTRCLATRALSFNVGETRTFSFPGTSTAEATQTVSFTRR